MHTPFYPSWRNDDFLGKRIDQKKIKREERQGVLLQQLSPMGDFLTKTSSETPATRFSQSTVTHVTEIFTKIRKLLVFHMQFDFGQLGCRLTLEPNQRLCQFYR